MTAYLDTDFQLNAKLSDTATKIVVAQSALRECQIALQSILNAGGSYSAAKIEAAANHPLVNTGPADTGAAVADSVTNILDAMDEPGFKNWISTLYQGQ
jgi:hypothetical protein